MKNENIKFKGLISILSVFVIINTIMIAIIQGKSEVQSIITGIILFTLFQYLIYKKE